MDRVMEILTEAREREDYYEERDAVMRRDGDYATEEDIHNFWEAVAKVQELTLGLDVDGDYFPYELHLEDRRGRRLTPFHKLPNYNSLDDETGRFDVEEAQLAISACIDLADEALERAKQIRSMINYEKRLEDEREKTNNGRLAR